MPKSHVSARISWLQARTAWALPCALVASLYAAPLAEAAQDRPEYIQLARKTNAWVGAFAVKGPLGHYYPHLALVEQPVQLLGRRGAKRLRVPSGLTPEEVGSVRHVEAFKRLRAKTAAFYVEYGRQRDMTKPPRAGEVPSAQERGVIAAVSDHRAWTVQILSALDGVARDAYQFRAWLPEQKTGDPGAIKLLRNELIHPEALGGYLDDVLADAAEEHANGVHRRKTLRPGTLQWLKSRGLSPSSVKGSFRALVQQVLEDRGIDFGNARSKGGTFQEADWHAAQRFLQRREANLKQGPYAQGEDLDYGNFFLNEEELVSRPLAASVTADVLDYLVAQDTDPEACASADCLGESGRPVLFARSGGFKILAMLGGSKKYDTTSTERDVTCDVRPVAVLGTSLRSFARTVRSRNRVEQSDVIFLFELDNPQVDALSLGQTISFDDRRQRELIDLIGLDLTSLRVEKQPFPKGLEVPPNFPLELIE